MSLWLAVLKTQLCPHLEGSSRDGGHRSCLGRLTPAFLAGGPPAGPVELGRGENTKPRPQPSATWAGLPGVNREPTPSWTHPPLPQAFPTPQPVSPGAWLTGRLSHQRLLDLGAGF